MAQQEQLTAFIAWWRANITGNEKSEAQIFTDKLMQAFGHEGAIETGGTYEYRIKQPRASKDTTTYADYVLPRVVLLEMKKRGENLADHYRQIENYWKALTDARPRYAILCNFDELWIYDFNIQFYDPVDRVHIEQLIERKDALEFLVKGSNKTPVFQNNLIEVTKEAAFRLSQVFQSLEKHDDVDNEIAQRYVLQCMLAMYAEDSHLLPEPMFTRVVEDCLAEKASSYDLITSMFMMMNMPGKKAAGRFYGMDYFNGGIFKQIHPIALSKIELNQLRDATRENWSKVKPAIFGTVFEDSLTKDARHKIGAHFTSEQDIKRVIDPVIVDPWLIAIEAAKTVEELLALHEQLCAYIVLDPACGSGNFLYVAYIEVKSLEAQLLAKLLEKGGTLPEEQRVTVKQFYGYDINEFAVELAKVTLMIAKQEAVLRTQSDESALPLDNMDDNILCVDALLHDWVDFDACIGNPPYMGAKRLKQEHSSSYINEIRDEFPDVPGNADYCVYWFRKAHDNMKTGDRAGLVGTNTIRQNYSRMGGLDYIVANNGVIYDAISTMPWSGEAVVHVSVVNWSKGVAPISPAKLHFFESVDDEGEYQFRDVEKKVINSSLSEETDVSGAKSLRINKKPKRVFQGQIPGHSHFVFEPDEAITFVRKDSNSAKVLFPFLIGDDLVGNPQGQPSRLVLDLNQYNVIEAQQFRGAYEHIKKHILPVREEKAKQEEERNALARADNPTASINHHHRGFLNNWWKHSYGRNEMWSQLATKKRFIGCSQVSKRAIFDFVSTSIRPDQKIVVFVFDDDYTFGILQSNLHRLWWWERGSTLKSDPTYTPTSVFNTFPFPQQPDNTKVKAVAEAGRALHEYRRAEMAKRETLTLRDMYRTLEMPGNNPLRDLHDALDMAVIAAYGFDADDDLLAQLLALNYEVAAKIEANETVTAPGIPQDYPEPDNLISEGCIMPPDLI